ncbi:MAG TPA: hypothetical protein VMY18_08180 [Acidobacteriota bacterium]|nr:hypothetical protein [Acidobacteriota bacterium]
MRSDSILRQALAGETAAGTVLLSPERLQLEGGPALANALLVEPRDASTDFEVQGSLFQWLATPLFDSGRVVALL